MRDRTDPEAAIAEAVAKYSNWGRWGPDDVLGTASAGWPHRTQIAAIAAETDAFQPLHQVAIPHIGVLVGEMWDLDALAEHCASDGRYEFLLVAAPLPITGAVGSPVNPIAIK